MKQQPKCVFYADFVLAPLAVLTLSSRAEFSISFFALVAAGIGLWTLFEYAIHRVTHVIKSPVHFRHHRFPLELSGPTTLTTAPIYFGIYFGISYALGDRYANALTSGLLLGFSVYLFTHALIHRAKIGPNHLLAKAKARHERHHAGSRADFGVTSDFWDKIFN